MTTTRVTVGQYAAGLGVAGVAVLVLGIAAVHLLVGVVQAPLALLSGACLLAVGVLLPVRSRRALEARTGVAVGVRGLAALSAVAVTAFGAFFALGAAL